MLVQHISELEEWDAILLQELSFKDELLSLEELEASLGGHKLVANGMSVGYGHYHSLSVDGLHSLVCFVTVCIVGWVESRGGVYLMLCAPAELGE